MKHGLFNIHTFIGRFAIILCMLTVILILIMTRFQWLLESPGSKHFYSFFFLSSNSFCGLLSTLQISTPYCPSLVLHFMVQLLLSAGSLIKRWCKERNMGEESPLPSLSLSTQESLQSQMFVSPLKPYAETYSQGDGIGRWSLWEEISLWGKNLMNIIHVL